MLPLVSVLTPTYGREGLLRRALALFQAYRYPNLEWILVDDSPEPATGIQGPGIRYIHLKDRMVLGSKHNLAASLAQGEILVHRDDDDLYSPESLTRQVEAILLHGASITGFRVNYIREERSGQFLRFRRDAKWTPSNETTVPLFTFHDSNAAFHRRIWDLGIQYTTVPVAQKVHFLNAAVRAGFSWKALENQDEFIYSRGAGNTWQFPAHNMTRVAAPYFGWLREVLGRAA